MELRRSMKTIKDNVEFSCLTNAQSDQQVINQHLLINFN